LSDVVTRLEEAARANFFRVIFEVAISSAPWW